jgi:hypothetical protein
MMPLTITNLVARLDSLASLAAMWGFDYLGIRLIIILGFGYGGNLGIDPTSRIFGVRSGARQCFWI